MKRVLSVEDEMQVFGNVELCFWESREHEFITLRGGIYCNRCFKEVVHGLNLFSVVLWDKIAGTQIIKGQAAGTIKQFTDNIKPKQTQK